MIHYAILVHELLVLESKVLAPDVHTVTYPAHLVLEPKDHELLVPEPNVQDMSHYE